jgi:hypothetical protein
VPPEALSEEVRVPRVHDGGETVETRMVGRMDVLDVRVQMLMVM